MNIEIKKIVDERCSCGHLKSQHLPQIHPSIDFAGEQPLFVNSHGSCKLCDCKKFTWVAFVFAEEVCECCGIPVKDLGMEELE